MTGIKSVIFDPAHEPSANQINDLWLMYGGNGHYYGEALAMLHILGETTEIPEVILPIGARIQSTSFEEDKNRRKDWFGVYPNPVVDEVFLTYPEELDGIGQVSLINVLGQRVFSTIPKGGGIISVDMSSFPSGVYSLSITLDNQLLAKLSIVKL